jgi:predicted site-specific integrase-resolvase
MVRHMALREEWMSLAEAAELYRVTPDTMQGWAKTGRFTARRFAGELWVSRAELHAALRRRPARGEDA